MHTIVKWKIRIAFALFKYWGIMIYLRLSPNTNFVIVFYSRDFSLLSYFAWWMEKWSPTWSALVPHTGTLRPRGSPGRPHSLWQHKRVKCTPQNRLVGIQTMVKETTNNISPWSQCLKIMDLITRWAKLDTDWDVVNYFAHRYLSRPGYVLIQRNRT